MNETERRQAISIGLTQVYLNAIDAKPATKTWQEVMEHIDEKQFHLADVFESQEADNAPARHDRHRGALTCWVN